MKRVKLGIVGCGFISEYYKKVFDILKEKIEIVGTCDLDIDRAKDTAKFINAKYAFSNYMDLFEKVDALLLAIPNHVHKPIAIECLNAGKHILLEKPLANSEEDCLDIIHVSQKSGTILMVAYIMRYHPMVVKLKDIIEKKEYGELFQMSIWTEQYTCFSGDSWLASAEKLGGGQFFSHGCHYVDLLLWYMGNPLRGVHFGTRLCTPWMEKEGTSNAIFEFESGKLAYHFGTWGTKGTRHSYCIHAFFENGMVECLLNEGKMNLIRTKKLSNYFEKSDEEIEIFSCEPTSHLPQYEIEHFADCILQNKAPVTSGPVALQGHRVIWRMYEAEKKNLIADLRGLGLNDEWDIKNLGKLPDIKY